VVFDLVWVIAVYRFGPSVGSQTSFSLCTCVRMCVFVCVRVFMHACDCGDCVPVHSCASMSKCFLHVRNCVHACAWSARVRVCTQASCVCPVLLAHVSLVHGAHNVAPGLGRSALNRQSVTNSKHVSAVGHVAVPLINELKALVVTSMSCLTGEQTALTTRPNVVGPLCQVHLGPVLFESFFLDAGIVVLVRLA